MMRDGGKQIGVNRVVIGLLERRGLLAFDGAMLMLTETGLAAAKRANAVRSEQYKAQHLDIEMQCVVGAETIHAVNLNESPLAQIARRKDKQGNPFLAGDEFRAGERLRADYTRGQIMPRLGANWEAAVSPRGGGASGGVAELTEAALSARIRVEKALAAVGPELSGVLVDVCCFLKGLETVEAERCWPARSAKLMLKAGLATLARHYEPAQTRRHERMLHWGAHDYRPSIA
ncbi:MAG: hypothetical protein KF874_05610 [Rhizobiaceae bacterium]|nr:hypothetical protein [Rhizobiaceae bacterium]